MTASPYTPFDVSNRDRIVGFFVIGAVLLFLAGFLIPFIKELSDEDGIVFYTVVEETYGIAPEATVTLKGVQIGNVSSVALTVDDEVNVTITLSHEYQEYYREGSQLEIDSNLGFNTILVGSGLILKPGPSGSQMLDAGALIETTPPTSIGSMVDQLDIEQIAADVNAIVTNVKMLTDDATQTQGKLFQTLENMTRISNNLATATESLPETITALNQAVAEMTETINSIDELRADSEGDIKKLIEESARLAAETTQTLNEAEILMRETTPVMQQLPAVMATSDVAMQSVTRLTDQLSRHWLLGGTSSESGERSVLERRAHPYDDELYESAPDTEK